MESQMAPKQAPAPVTTDATKAAQKALGENLKRAREEYSRTVAAAKLKRDQAIAAAYAELAEATSTGDAE